MGEGEQGVIRIRGALGAFCFFRNRYCIAILVGLLQMAALYGTIGRLFYRGGFPFAFPMTIMLLPMSIYTVRKWDKRALMLCLGTALLVAFADIGLTFAFGKGYVDLFFRDPYWILGLFAWLCAVPLASIGIRRDVSDAWGKTFDRWFALLGASAAAFAVLGVSFVALWEMEVRSGAVPFFGLGPLFAVVFIVLQDALSRMAVPLWKLLPVAGVVNLPLILLPLPEVWRFPAIAVSMLLLASMRERTGEGEVPDHSIAAVRCVLGELLLLSGRITWTLCEVVSTYGWSLNRVLAALFLFFAVGWIVAWTWVVFLRRDEWLTVGCRINRLSLSFAAFCAFALLTPFFNPHRIAANAQVARLQEGRVSPEAFDYEYLVELRRPGKEALERLSCADGFEGAEVVRDRASHELDVRDWEWL